jgi:uncharacterized protein (TIGR02266 family)
MTHRAVGAKTRSDTEPGSPDSPAGLDRRMAPRVLVDFEVDYASEDNFLFAYITDLSATGIFIRTTQPEPPGTQLNLRFTPPPDHAGFDDDDRDSGPLALEGEVIWINPYRPDDTNNLNPGMGVRFLGLQAIERDRLVELVRRFAYL